MSEEKLKKYWQAYTDAWMLMKNREKVTEKHIGEMISRHNIGIMSRLFCLVVWQEIKRIKSGGSPQLEKEYQKAFTVAWKLFKQSSDPNDIDEFWDELVKQIHELGNEFGESQFIRNLLIHVVLEEIEQIYRRDRNDQSGIKTSETGEQ